MKYHEKLAAAVRARLGEGVEVYADTSMICFDKAEPRARATAWMPDRVDRRSAPTEVTVSDVIAAAARKLRSEIPKYKPEFVEPSRAFAAELDAAATRATTTAAAEGYVPNPNPDAAGDDFDEPEVDVASLPDCGEDFMAGTICSLAEGHVDRDGTAHAAECRRCGVDWIKNDGCDCPPKDEDLPTVPLDDEGAPIDSFEVMAVRYLEDETRAASADEADAWGIYVIFEDAPTMHVEDYPTSREAERFAAALAVKHDSEWRNISIPEADLDTASSSSRQHWIETGRYLTVKEVREQEEADVADAREKRAQRIEAVYGTVGMSDQPTTCGKCGRRTEYDDLADKDGESRQLHTCACGHVFVVESDREWDTHDEEHDLAPVEGCSYCPTEDSGPVGPLTRLRAAVENDYESDVLAALIERAGLDLAPAG